MEQVISKVKYNHCHLAIPLFFVCLYGSGFVGAKMGLPYAEPLTFLALRFSIAAIILAIVTLITKAPWPNRWQDIGHMSIAGIMMHSVFSAGVFEAIHFGVQPAVSALIIALQPIVVAIGAGPIVGEKISNKQWFGLLLGLFGVVLVVSNKLTFTHTHIIGILLSFVGLFGLCGGNLYQKRFCADMDIRTGGLIHSVSAAIVMLVLALLTENTHIQWSGQFIFALFYMSVVVSIGALSLLYIMIRRGEVSQVASIFYLVPVCAAIVSYFIYGETMGPMAILGMVIAAMGVTLVTTAKRSQ